MRPARYVLDWLLLMFLVLWIVLGVLILGSIAFRFFYAQ